MFVSESWVPTSCSRPRSVDVFTHRTRNSEASINRATTGSCGSGRLLGFRLNFLSLCELHARCRFPCFPILLKSFHAWYICCKLLSSKSLASTTKSKAKTKAANKYTKFKMKLNITLLSLITLSIPALAVPNPVVEERAVAYPTLKGYADYASYPTATSAPPAPVFHDYSKHPVFYCQTFVRMLLELVKLGLSLRTDALLMVFLKLKTDVANRWLFLIWTVQES